MQFQSFDESYVERLRAGDFRTQEHFVAYFSELLQLKLRSRLHSPRRSKTCDRKLSHGSWPRCGAAKFVNPSVWVPM